MRNEIDGYVSCGFNRRGGRMRNDARPIGEAFRDIATHRDTSDDRDTSGEKNREPAEGARPGDGAYGSTPHPGSSRTGSTPKGDARPPLQERSR
jgi:hypothetical protein